MARRAIEMEEEALPEADRLEGSPHPRETRQLFGHGLSEARLAEAVASGRLHHGWMLTGPRGIGKATLAYRFAAFLLAEAGERQAARNAPSGPLAIPAGGRTDRQVRALSHPGMLVIRRPWDRSGKRFAATIPVDEVRRLRAFLGRTADAGAYRVVIVDSADELNTAAANALLKSLEEPPPRTVFLLICAEPGRMLATIRSRCRLLAVAALEPPDLRSAVDGARASAGAEPLDEAAWARLLPLSHGSPRRALWLAESDGIALADTVDGLLKSLPRLDWRKAHALADDLAGAAGEQRFAAFYDLLLSTLARSVRDAACGGPAALACQSPARVALWADLWETLGRELQQALALNLDRRTLILDTLARLEAAARADG